MAMNKYGAPATSHVRMITAEDVEVMTAASEALSKVPEEDIKNEKEDNREEVQRGTSDESIDPA
jgi:F0F1-type ATP synthase membrane subunit b/b'